jgi:hypothetical protein
MDDGAAAAKAKADGLVVACFLRASLDAFPKTWKQGWLHLTQPTVCWARGMRQRTDGTALPEPLQVVAVRDVGGPGEWRLKRGFFKVIELETSAGPALLAVPTDSVALVVGRLRRDQGPT